MFTGIVRTVGRVVATRESAGRRLTIDAGSGLGPLALGDSIAVSGVCLTVCEVGDGRFGVDLSGETLRRTTLAGLRRGDAVNLEPALTLATPLGGHLVAGHVDGVAAVTRVTGDAGARRVEFEAPAALARYLAPKGSVAIDGVSLTINDAAAAVFGVSLVPHTCAVTTLGALAPGALVNLEVDLLARYLERLSAARDAR